MKKRETCDECRFLAFDRAVNAYDVNRATCCDPDKPAMGARRVVAVSRIGLPRQIERPVWCRRKKEPARLRRADSEGKAKRNDKSPCGHCITGKKERQGET